MLATILYALLLALSSQLGQTMEHQGLIAAVQEFVTHLENSKIPIADWGQYVTTIFGKKAGAGIGVLVDQVGRLETKLPDIKKGADDFASAWAALGATPTKSPKRHHRSTSSATRRPAKRGARTTATGMPAHKSTRAKTTNAAVRRKGTKNLTVASNNAGVDDFGLEGIDLVLKIGP